MNKINPTFSLRKLKLLFAICLVSILGLAAWIGMEISQIGFLLSSINNSLIIAILSLIFLFFFFFYWYFVTKKEILFR